MVSSNRRVVGRPVLRISGWVADFENLHETPKDNNLRLPSRQSGGRLLGRGVRSNTVGIANRTLARRLAIATLQGGALLLIWNAFLTHSLRQLQMLVKLRETPIAAGKGTSSRRGLTGLGEGEDLDQDELAPRLFGANVASMPIMC